MSNKSLAERNRSIAQFLMQGALTPPKGQMIGRYYVGEGIGSGMTRLGQALLARRMESKADALEQSDQLAAQERNKAAIADLTSAFGEKERVDKEYDGDLSGLTLSSVRKPNNQEIAAALLNYQNSTGQQLPDNVSKMLIPDAGGADAFGTTVRRNGHTYQLTKSGQLVDLGEGFDEPTRALDIGGAYIIQPTIGAPRTLGTVDKGVSPDKVYDVNAAPGKAAAVAAAEGNARREQANLDKGETAGNAVELLDRYMAAVAKQPRTAAGRGYETALGAVGAGNEGQQNAMADAENLGASIVTYAQKQPGPSSDADVQNYMTQVGILGNKLATRDQRLSAARSAKESYLRVVQKYGANWSGGAAAPAGNAFDAPH